MHICNLPYVFSTSKVIIVELVPQGQCSELPSGELGQWTEIQPVDGSIGNVQKDKDSDGKEDVGLYPAAGKPNKIHVHSIFLNHLERLCFDVIGA